MNSLLGQSRSVWMPGSLPSPLPLLSDLEADVCVVGAGIAGLSTAYLLGRAGKSVVILDDGPIGGGQTERTTAHLSNAIDDRYVAIERLHGQAGARLAAHSQTAAIDQIERTVAEEGIACGFQRLDGYLFVPPGVSPEALGHELLAAHRAGLADVAWVDRAPFADFDTGPCLRFPRQGQFQPLQYLAGLVQRITGDGGRLFSGAHVVEVAGGRPARIRTRAGVCVTAQSVVVATNTPINDRFEIHTKQAPHMTYAIALGMSPGPLVPALFWDTLDPYHYARFHQDGPGGETLLIVGGEDHRTGQEGDAGERYARLETWARERFPELSEIRARWSGQVLETFDGLGFIGRNPLDDANVFIATGDSGMGMTHGTVAGMLITDLILGVPNPWAELYDPARKTLRALPRFVADAANQAWQYKSWLTPGDLESAEGLPRCHGGILRRGLKKVAVYRDEMGDVHELSAVCPHLGGIVAWNAAEATWDCPCHGSRFDRFGKVISGPAISDLSREG